MKTTLYNSWRFAYPDCKVAKEFVDSNVGDYEQFLAPKRMITLGGVAIAIMIGDFVFSALWDSFIKSSKITPQYAIIFGVALFLIIILWYFADWKSHNIAFMESNMKVSGYQDIWPTIVDVIEANEDNIFLPPEPLRADYVEIPVLDEKFVQEKFSKPMFVEDRTEPLDYSKLIEDKRCAELLEEKVVEENDEDDMVLESFDDFYQKWNLLDNKGVV